MNGLPFAQFTKSGRNSSRFLDTVGDGSGSVDGAVNGAVTPVDFKVTCPEGYIYLINYIVIAIVDTGIAWDATKYGFDITCTNGLRSIVKRGAVEFDRTLNYPILSNFSWIHYGFNLEYNTFGVGITQGSLMGTYSFVADGAPVHLYPGDSYIIRIMDDLAGLDEHSFRVGMIQTKL